MVVHMEYHILLFSFDSLLLPVVGLNKMGPKRRGGGTLFARNVTVAE